MARPGGNPRMRDPEYQKELQERRREKQTEPTVAVTREDLFRQVDALIEDATPDLVRVLIDKARKDKDKQAAMYLLDRRYGRVGDRSNERPSDFERTLLELSQLKTE